MRNLLEYPITNAEKIAVLRGVIADYLAKDADDPDPIVGDITHAALCAIMSDLYRATLSDEDIRVAEVRGNGSEGS